MRDAILDCEGAPRDLGLDQGRACRAELAARFRSQAHWRRALFRLGRGDARSRRLDRDLSRHFPQQSEFLEGLTRGAAVPRSWLVAMLDRTFSGMAHTRVGDAVGVLLEPSLAGGRTLLARTFAAEPSVRRSRPDAGFASLELTLPWLSAALAGVNAGGLAAAGVALAPVAPGTDCAVPAALLVQDCLSRFDSREGAVDWCLGRPVGGRAAILLADARGCAAVEIDGAARRVETPKDGLLLEGLGEGDLAGALRRDAPLDAKRLDVALGRRVVCLDPLARRLGFRRAGDDAVSWLDVDASAQARE